MFGSLEVYILCVAMMSMEVWKFGSLHVVCDDNTFGSLHIVCDDDKFGSLEVWRFTHCV